MSRKDGTGPMGQGEMTGRGLGPCNGANTNLYDVGFGRGAGRGSNRGTRCGAGMGFFGRKALGRNELGSYNAKTEKEALTEDNK